MTSKEIYDTINAVFQIFNSEDIQCWGNNSAESERFVRRVHKALEEAKSEVDYFRLTQSWE